ncbi:hypothetical protein BH24CHL7_BH24CHL7_03870 [soil metagenome]
MNEPRNVTPGPEAEPRTTDSFGRPQRRDGDEGPEWQAWTWGSRGTGFPWLGVLLVLIGIGLLIRYLVPTVSVGTLILLAVGLAFLVGWLLGRSWFAMVPGVLLISLGTAELLEDLALFGPPGQDVAGLGSAALAVGFLVIFVAAMARGRRWTLALWAAGLFGLIAVVQLSGRLVGIPELGALWPVAIIAIGVIILLNARRR